jgi:hypothetical protein
VNNGTPKIETKTIKHTFTPPEREQLNGDLLNALEAIDTAESDFENVKATWKAKITEAEAHTGTIRAKLRAGFDMRQERCVVVYRYKERKKDYFLEAHLIKSEPDGVPVLTEEMTEADFQAELLAAESQFENREEIELFRTGNDSGILVVGQFKNRWFSAVRLTVGNRSLSERLDSEQRAFKERFPAITTAATNALAWLKDNFKDHAKGFAQPINDAIEAQKERVE